jgi:hypothetical protein
MPYRIGNLDVDQAYRTSGATADRSHDNEKSPALTKRKITAGAIAAMIAVGTVFGVEKAINTVKANQLVTQLEKAGPKADENYFNGDYQDKPVTAVELEQPQNPATAASNMATSGHVIEVQDIISAEQGPNIEPGDIVVVPRDMIKENTPHQIAPIPEDPNVHVG